MDYGFELPRDFDAGLVRKLEEEYWTRISDSEEEDEKTIEDKIKPIVTQQGYLSKPDFLKVCSWKSQRPSRDHKQNEEGEIEEATRFALSADTERTKLGCLTALHGVGVRTASVILHWFHPHAYPIVDVRALGALGYGEDEVPNSLTRRTLAFWSEYIEFFRNTVNELKVKPRALDRALWTWHARRTVDHSSS